MRIIPQEIEIGDIKSTYGMGNIYSPKTERIIRAWEEKIDKILIFMDADGRPIEDMRRELRRLIGNSQKVKEIIFEQEIEEWITASVQKKPSKELEMKYGYKKYMLPKYVDKVISNYSESNLMKLRSFRDFIEALNDPR